MFLFIFNILDLKTHWWLQVLAGTHKTYVMKAVLYSVKIIKSLNSQPTTSLLHIKNGTPETEIGGTCQVDHKQMWNFAFFALVL